MVVYKTPIAQIDAVISSFLNESTIQNISVYIFDNGMDLILKDYCSRKNFNYLTLNRNVGFGRGHNFILNSTLGIGKSYLILNPDLYLTSGALNGLYEFMDSHQDCGAVSPKILNHDNTIQDVCRLLPSPIELIFRRFFYKYLKPYSLQTEFQFANYEKVCHVPFIHGACFLIRGSVYSAIKGFDERYFLYMEDVDICRKISQSHRVYFYPEVSAVHSHAKGSYKSVRLLYFHIHSAIYYFNKWGWFFDASRKRTNEEAFKDLLFYPKSRLPK